MAQATCFQYNEQLTARPRQPDLRRILKHRETVSLRFYFEIHLQSAKFSLSHAYRAFVNKLVSGTTVGPERRRQVIIAVPAWDHPTYGLICLYCLTSHE